MQSVELCVIENKSSTGNVPLTCDGLLGFSEGFTIQIQFLVPSQMLFWFDSK